MTRYAVALAHRSDSWTILRDDTGNKTLHQLGYGSAGHSCLQLQLWFRHSACSECHGMTLSDKRVKQMHKR